MRRDRFEQPVSTTSDSALEHYVQALDALFAMQMVARPLIDQALAADPEFALAHCVDARVKLFEGDTRAAIAAAERAEQLANATTPREREHSRIVAMVTRGENAAALPAVRAHADAHPRDALPLSFALGVYSLLGFGGLVDHHQQQVALLESVADAWGEDWWYLSWLGWSLVEVGEWDKGVAMLDRALELKPDNANAAHGRAHGYYEMGAAEEAVAFLGKWLPGYAPSEPLHCHISWHQALTLLQLGELDQALAVYDTSIRPEVSAALPMFTMVDCAAFAWRARLYGFELDASRLQEVVSFTERSFPQPSLPFVDVHGMLGRGLKRDDSAAAFAAAIAVVDPNDDPTQVLNVQLCSALASYQDSDFKAAADRLESLLPVLPMLGGSHAQRDVLIDTAVSARLRSGDSDRARALLEQRNSRRAAHLDEDFFGRLLA